MGDGYILDGMGHTITMTPGDDGKITISGNVRDVYITDGTNTIYIDKDGKIYSIDPDTGEKTATGDTLTSNSTIQLKS